MKLRLFLATTAAALALGLSGAAYATSEARVVPPGWGSERIYTFAIYQPAVGRIATAYYRLVQKEFEGRPVYEIRYNGTSGSASEASVCTVDAVTLEPYRSSRKIKTPGDVFYIDTFYGDGRIVVRRKQGEEGEVRETSQDFPGRVFDFEELMWLVPQLDFSSDDRLHFALFWTVGDQINLVVVRRMEQDAFEFHGKTHQAVRYDFSLGMIRQSLWVQELDGVPTVLKYDTGEYVFYNLSLAEGAAAAPAPEATAAAPEEEAAPAEEAEAEAEEAAEEEETGEEEEPPVLYDDEGNPYIPF